MCDPALLKRIADLEEEVIKLRADVEERLRWNDLPPWVDMAFIQRELDNMRYFTADRHHSHNASDSQTPTGRA